MTGRFPRRVLLRGSSTFKNGLESASAPQRFTSSGSFDGASFSSDALPPFHSWLGWPSFLRGSHTYSASKPWACQQYNLPSSRSCSSYLSYSHCTFAQSFATPSVTITLHTRRFADDAAEPRDCWCWSCEHGTLTGNGLFCPSCKVIQPLDPTVDFFRIFTIDRSFKVDVKALEQSYKDLQKKLHPDLAGSKSHREQGYSAEQSAHVIQAYYILLRPLSRARYLLGLHGIKVEEEGTIDDPELLMEIMEIRETIEEISDTEMLKNAQADNYDRVLDCEKELESAFRAKDLKRAASYVQRLAYYIKVGEEILRRL